MVRHILLTNDFPPKVGGIQSYLWELWRRLPPDDVTVYTASYPGAAWWDREQKFRIVRAKEPVLLPQPYLARQVRRLAASVGAEAVVIDPALPLGLTGPSLGLPYAVVLHGAEVAVPGRLPVSRQLLARALNQASLWVAAGRYPEAEARRAAPNARPQVVTLPPGVDTERFQPLPAIERAAARAHFGLPTTGPLAVSVSRLVPRKGMDTLIEAVARVAPRFPGLSLAIAGAGRDRARLERLAARTDVPIKFAGKLADSDLPRFYGCADVFALCCRSRWWGLEQEGFGIVLVEAASCAAPCITVDSGGAGEAVLDGGTGLVVPGGASRSAQVAGVAEALATVLSAPARARQMGDAGRRRIEEELSYDLLAERLRAALDEAFGRNLGTAGGSGRADDGEVGRPVPPSA